MELVTGAMGSLLPKLAELLKEEYGMQKGVKKKIESLSRELEVVHAVLHKIGSVPPEQLDELVTLWVRDVREASYDMEDMVDTFLVRVDDGLAAEAADPHMLRRLRKKVGGLFKKSKARRKISCLVQDNCNKLEEVAARRARYNIDSIVSRYDSIVAKPVAATTIDPRVLNLYKRATELIGIDGPRDELIEMFSLGDDITDVPDDKTKVISVVGYGGLGKTTLAKAVYDQLKLNFEHNAFVPVGRNPDMKKVFRDILIDLDKEKYTRNINVMVLDEKQLMDQLNDFAKGKRCFIVIDDVWEKETWKLVECPLQDGNCGSRVLVTTRIFEVATYAGEVYKIQPLSHDNSEKLLYARIDGEGKHFDRPSAEACDKILKKCGGVPLAIITVASLLASKPGEDWSEVYNRIGFGHGGNDVVENTRKILSFSYYDLPSHLKACLLYLSVFPEDERIDKNRLIWMWIAEGFIINEDKAAGMIGLFELGERCFNELINRSMIQPLETYDEGDLDGYHVHDMVYDLVRSLSSKENFVTALDGDERHKLPGRIARRLALRRIEEEKNCGQLANITMDKVRSLIAARCNFSSLCQRTPVLRLLDFEDCYGQDFLDPLWSLHHLRYLRLACGQLIELPREVRHLKFLQTLDLGGSLIEELPEEVGQLTKLVCLRAELLYDSAIRVPAGLIGKLTSLQELSMSHSVVTMQFVKELGMLRELRVLRISIYVSDDDESMEKALLESLGNLHNIRTLYIRGSIGHQAMQAGQLMPCQHLQYLHFECMLSGLPAWIRPSLAPNLSYLRLQMKALREQDMEALASMPELRCLHLLLLPSHRDVGIKIRTQAGNFPKLRILRIEGSAIWFHPLRGGCEYTGSRVASATVNMPSLEYLDFRVRVLFLMEKADLNSVDRMLGFESLGTTSLRRVDVEVRCGGALTSEVKQVEAVLQRTAAAHPKRPTLQTTRRHR